MISSFIPVLITSGKNSLYLCLAALCCIFVLPLSATSSESTDNTVQSLYNAIFGVHRDVSCYKCIRDKFTKDL